MPIALTCPNCSATLRVADAAAGRRAKCPKCGDPFIVPDPTAVAETTALDRVTEPPPFEPVPDEPPDTKDCPYCGELIKAVAVKCKHCGERFGAAWATDPPPAWSAPAARSGREADRPRPRRRDDYEDDVSGCEDDEDDFGDEHILRQRSRCSKPIYIANAIFFGGFGFHNFYAGRIGEAIAQLLLGINSFVLIMLGDVTLGPKLPLGFVGVIALFVWNLVDIATVNRDGQGREFR